jgi:hypothetical protein
MIPLHNTGFTLRQRDPIVVSRLHAGARAVTGYLVVTGGGVVAAEAEDVAE